MSLFPKKVVSRPDRNTDKRKHVCREGGITSVSAEGGSSY